MNNITPIALFYGSSTCYTEFVGEKIAKTLEKKCGENTVHIFKVGDDDLQKIQGYHNIILGIPTWDYGELQEDWENHWPELDQIDFENKTVALYGVGDQVGYPEWFLDALGYLHDKVQARGAKLIGYWPNEGYKFSASQALNEDGQFFLGLAIDEENQFDLTEERIDRWVTQILQEFGFD